MTRDNMNMNAGGVKNDAGKIRMDLVPQDAVMAIAAVFTYGAIKYADWNWAKGMRDGRLDAAYERHRAAYMLGEELDEESGLPHLWHMGCCVLMRIAADLRGVLEDDRPASDGMWEASAELDALHIVRDLAAGMNDPRGTPAQDWAEKAPPEGNGITFTEMSEAFRGMRDDAMEKAVATYTAHDNLAAKLCEGLKDLDNEDRAKPGSIFDEINEKLRRDFYVDEPMAEQEDPAITQWKQMAAEEIEIAVREVMTGEVSEISLSLPSPNADLSDTKAMELARWVQQRVTMEIALWH